MSVMSLFSREDEKLLHLRLDGQSQDIRLTDLNVQGNCSDEDIRRALASFLDTSADKFNLSVIERHETGNITVRPQAVFG